MAITSTGTGAGNAAGALIESLTAGSAVLHVTGQIESQWLGRGRGVIHETLDQLGMLRAISKTAATLDRRGAAGSVLREAAAAALRSPRGPVSVEWPIDLQYIADDGHPDDAGSPQAVKAIDIDSVERAAELIRRARRPLVWAGGGAVAARTAVDKFLDRTGAGLLTSNAGRGTLPEDDPRCVGNFAASAACEPLLEEADLLLSIGTHFRSNETRTYGLSLPRPHVQVDVDPAALGRVHPADVGLQGDAAAVLATLLDVLGDATEADPDWAERIQAVREEVRRDLAAAIGPQAVICQALREALPRDSVIARDVTIPSSTWGNRLLPIYEPWTNLYPRGGGIGQGLSFGIGAAIARPSDPTAVIVGDGGLVAQMGELATLAQERPWVVVILFNDLGYGVLRNMQDRYVGRRSGVDLTTPDFSVLADAFELRHHLVTDVYRFGAALDDVLSSGGPAIVEVDLTAIGEMPRPFIPPVAQPEPGTEGERP